MTTVTRTHSVDNGVMSVTFNGEIRHVIAGDTNPIIQVAPGGSCTVTSYTPAWDPVLLRNGAFKYPAGNIGAPFNWNFDGRLSTSNPTPPAGYPVAYHARQNVPITLIPGDVLFIARSHPTFSGSYPSLLWPGSPNPSSPIDEMMVVSCVDYDINPLTTGAVFRPPALGISSLAFALRALPTPESLLDLTKLPSVIDLNAVGTAAGISMPSITFYENKFKYFAGDILDGWGAAYTASSLNANLYGQYFAGLISCGMLYLCSTLPSAQKRNLARSMVQWGLDLVGAVVDGRTYYANGGHCHGRKALIVLAGHLLNCWPFLKVSSFFPGPIFAEDSTFFKQLPRAWWWTTNPWVYGWRFQAPVGMPGASAFPPYLDGSQLTTAPSIASVWGDPGENFHGQTHGWSLGGYMSPNCGAYVGIVLGMKLMGISQDYGEAVTGMINQWMVGPPTAERNALNAYLLSGSPPASAMAWGTSTGLGADGMAAAAWNLYNP